MEIVFKNDIARHFVFLKECQRKKALQPAKEKEIELKKKIDLYKYNPDLILFQDLWENYLNFYASKH